MGSLKLKASLTTHALDRYREHHEDADYTAIHMAMEAGLTIERHEALRHIPRKWAVVDATYILAPDCRGVFVILPPSAKDIEAMARTGRSARHTAVTHLRFTRTTAAKLATLYARRLADDGCVRHALAKRTPEEVAAREQFEASIAREPGRLKPSQLRRLERRAVTEREADCALGT